MWELLGLLRQWAVLRAKEIGRERAERRKADAKAAQRRSCAAGDHDWHAFGPAYVPPLWRHSTLGDYPASLAVPLDDPANGSVEPTQYRRCRACGEEQLGAVDSVVSRMIGRPFVNWFHVTWEESVRCTAIAQGREIEAGDPYEDPEVYRGRY